MKLVTYSKEGSVLCGILTDNGIIDINSAWDGTNPPESIIEILQRGPDCLVKLSEMANSVEASLPTDSFSLMAPVPRPGKIIALAGTFAGFV